MTSLTGKQLETLGSICRFGASDASQALSKWLGRDIHMSVGQLEQVSLEEATESLGPPDATICACCMRVSGGLNGQLLFGFDDQSGLMLCDVLLSRETKSTAWGELETSAAMETTNIVGCAFLNALATVFPQSRPPNTNTSTSVSTSTDTSTEANASTWIPTPPVFVRDFAAAIMQFALVDQASEFDRVLIAQTRLTIDDTPVAWRLLLIPDAESLEQLSKIAT